MICSLSRDPLGYVTYAWLVINTTLGYGITASGEIGTLLGGGGGVLPVVRSEYAEAC